MREVTKVEFLNLYEQGLIFEVVNVGDRVIGRSVKGQADNPDRYEVVWCSVS